MPPTDSVRQNKIPIHRQLWGVRDSEGNINGKMNYSVMLRDLSRMSIVVLQGIILWVLFGAWGAFKWYIENKELPKTVKTHIEQGEKWQRKEFMLMVRMGEKLKIRVDDLLE